LDDIFAIQGSSLSGNQVDRQAAAVLVADVTALSRIRRIRAIIAPVTMMLLWAFAAQADDAPHTRLSGDIALTKATISLLAAKDISAVRDRLDAAMGQVSDDTLRRMSDVIGASEPVSVETIRATETHDLQTEAGNSRVVLEYGLTGKWVVVDAVVKTEAASKRFTRLYFTLNRLPLKELNAFHLFGKGPVQYLFLAGWIAAIGLTVLAICAAFMRHTGWRRFALVVLMPLGLTPTVAVNWNTAEIWVLEAINNPAGHAIPLFAFRYPMALFGSTEFHAPFLYVSAPLIAVGYLIWHWRSSQARPLLARAERAG
jgi:hypothetical protein